MEKLVAPEFRKNMVLTASLPNLGSVSCNESRVMNALTTCVVHSGNLGIVLPRLNSDVIRNSK